MRIQIKKIPNDHDLSNEVVMHVKLNVAHIADVLYIRREGSGGGCSRPFCASS